MEKTAETWKAIELLSAIDDDGKAEQSDSMIVLAISELIQADMMGELPKKIVKNTMLWLLQRIYIH